MKIKKTGLSSEHTKNVRQMAIVNLKNSDSRLGISRPVSITSEISQSSNIKTSSSQIVESAVIKRGQKTDVSITIFPAPAPAPAPAPGGRVTMSIIANRGYESSDQRGVCVDSAGNVYFGSTDGGGGGSLQKLNQATGTTTNCGSIGGSVYGISCERDGNVYIADTSNSRVLRFNPSTSIMTVIAGGNGEGSSGDGGLATSAQLGGPTDVKMDSHGNIYISDDTNCSIRKINSAGIITKFAGNVKGSGRPPYVAYTADGSAALSTNLSLPFGMAIDSHDNIYVSLQYPQNIYSPTTATYDYVRKIDAVTGIVSTYVGNGNIMGFNGDGNVATATTLYTPTGLVFDSSDNLYLSDSSNNRVLKIDAVSKVATRYAGDPTTNLGFTFPQKIALDSSGNLYINDYMTTNIYKVMRY